MCTRVTVKAGVFAAGSRPEGERPKRESHRKAGHHGQRDPKHAKTFSEARRRPVAALLAEVSGIVQRSKRLAVSEFVLLDRGASKGLPIQIAWRSVVAKTRARPWRLKFLKI